MAQPLRKIFQKNLLPGAEAPGKGWREREGRARQQEAGWAPAREGRPAKRQRTTLDLSGAATAALGLALVAAVGWAFFMGYLVGRGEHPERGVESVAGLLRPGAPATDGTAPRKPLPGEEALQGPVMEDAPSAAPQAAPVGEARADAESARGAAPAKGPAPVAGAEGAAPEPSAAYPFSRPQGEGLAAWGIGEGAQAPAQSGAPAAKAAPGQNPPPTSSRSPAHAANRATAATSVAAPPAATPPQPAEPRFDYLFQAAAFKGPVDAEKLRARLEAAGLRARVRPSGKVRLVLVSVRGTAQEARRVRDKLAGMGLGRPIQLEKKPVEEKPGGKGRRRSAP